MTVDEQVRIIVLNDGDHLEAVVRRFEQGWRVYFVLGDNLLGKSVVLKTSLSPHPLPWSNHGSALNAKAEVDCSTAGSFSYEFYVDGSPTRNGCGYFLVDPSLSINGSPLPLDSVVGQTHLAKLLGPLSEWKDRLRVSKESGYNMIHLTPIHSLGISNSSYSIKSHHELNETLNEKDRSVSFDEVTSLVNEMEKEWEMLTVQDVVWNHAAKNAPWLQEHPESAYNCENSPHLRPAYIVDRALHHFGREIGEGKWSDRGIPVCVDREEHIGSIAHSLRHSILPSLRLAEFFQCDVERSVHEFERIAKGGPSSDSLDEVLPLVQDEQYRRRGCTVDMQRTARIFNRTRGDASDESHRVHLCTESFRGHLLHLNGEGERKAQSIIDDIVGACCGHIRYERVDGGGPRKGIVTEKEPLLTDYFLHEFEEGNGWEEEEKNAFDEKRAKFLMAFNGWVMSHDPLKNFALSDSEVYLRRQLVCWGDSVKLNYGDRPDDSSFLWRYMQEYTEKCARIFHGVRIDNAHGTPIHVAEYLLAAARKIRPNLFVFAELFTGSEQLDNLFVNRLGITSLIREAQAAHDSHEQGRLVYRYGGDVVGAMVQKRIRLSAPSVAHAFFLDQSHDNPSPVQIRSVHDLLPTAAMITMASCAVGSTRGYDEVVPHAIHVVDETRLYARWAEGETNEESGLIGARRVLNQLHAKLAKEGFDQVFVDQMSPDVVGITRHNAVTHESVVVVSHTAFNKDAIDRDGRVNLRWIPICGVLEEILFEMEVKEERVEEKEDAERLLGWKSYRVETREHLSPCDDLFEMWRWREYGNMAVGALVRTMQPTSMRLRVTWLGSTTLDAALAPLTLQDMNAVLFKCEGEERESTEGRGGYHIPKHGTPVYCGLQGLIPILHHIRLNNDLGHPLCGNLRDGCWLVDYVHQRMRRYERLTELADKTSSLFAPLYSIPFFLRPAYFEALYAYLYRRVKVATLEKMDSSLLSADSLEQSLALSSVSLSGHVPNAGLPPLSDKIKMKDVFPSSLSAGSPHFSTGIWRNWGRDTFIAIFGCYLALRRYEDAKATILAYAGTLRHGLIPNLLAEGKSPRYNCRDAVWFWLYAVVRYVREAPGGVEILKAPVRRLYPLDSSSFGDGSEREEELRETMREAVERHWKGIEFRERNSGRGIDEHMRERGFDVSIRVDRETGLMHGGNEFNCGTWMDKMGSSEKAGNKGLPATPRDGAPVELQGLAYTVLSEMQKWSEKGVIEGKEIEGGDASISYDEWAKLIEKSFEREFYVDEETQGPHVNRRRILKDTVGSSAGYTDFQLRCNFPIALAVAPRLVSPIKAWAALDTARDALMGPLGMKTLDPSDWAYHGDYNNDDDGCDRATAKGWNYHQGPEWLWVAAYYLQARLAVAKELGGEKMEEARREVLSRLGAYRIALNRSPWRSLPELTNADGKHCAHSCEAQAWSVGCLLEVCQTLRGWSIPQRSNVGGESDEDEEEEGDNVIPRIMARPRFVFTRYLDAHSERKR
ncbi:agl-1, partial [Pristionchus pacificus]|uniref:Glycogen debranching enzyme n=1 Tax=Pristionchus pacificus TaxID=54126 RepID=A0A2A6B6X2_PRIPA